MPTSPPTSPSGPVDPTAAIDGPADGRGADHLRATFSLAVGDTLPLAVSLIPFALAIGSTSAGAGVDLATTLTAGLVMLAGASQLAATELWGSGADLSLILATVTLINARFLLYGGGLNRWFAGHPRTLRLALAALIVDQNYVVADRRFGAITDGRHRASYLLAATATLLVCYLPSQLVGHVIGAQVPAALGLHLAAPLAFVGMLGLAARTRPSVATAVVAAALVVAGSVVIGGAALPLACVIALAVGVALTPRPPSTNSTDLANPASPTDPQE